MLSYYLTLPLSDNNNKIKVALLFIIIYLKHFYATLKFDFCVI